MKQGKTATNQLTVEITESMVMEQDPDLPERIRMLREMGVGLLVDDFGTGFSGLSRLVSLPVTELKIDKSFVDRCLSEKRIQALLEAIVLIGQSLDLVVVAEGVETKAQFYLLHAIRCPVIQGYFFSHPRPAEEDHPCGWKGGNAAGEHYQNGIKFLYKLSNGSTNRLNRLRVYLCLVWGWQCSDSGFMKRE